VGKVVLAYSGGLDTSVAINWLREKYGLEVVCLTADVGEARDVAAIVDRALRIGAVACHVVDAKDEFITGFCWPALRANALYQGRYPLSAGLSRPLIARLMVEAARREGAAAVAHGCTGKGNDQVRFDVSTAALAPDLKVIAPVREWPMSREDEIEYARARDIPVPVVKASPYSIDQNLWGRSVECGVLEDPWAEPPADVYVWTADPAAAPDVPAYVEITFKQGIPVALDGAALDGVALVTELNRLAGSHGVGRIDMVEDRLVGIKSREIYEAPAATVLIAAHRELESLTLTREVLQYKVAIEQRYAELVYTGLWYSPLRDALDAFIARTQETVSGVVRMKLWKGQAAAVGRRSPHSLYDFALATYDRTDAFHHSSAAGFIELWGLPTKVHAAARARDRA
jgi:argininosuccinate synthase